MFYDKVNIMIIKIMSKMARRSFSFCTLSEHKRNTSRWADL